MKRISVLILCACCLCVAEAQPPVGKHLPHVGDKQIVRIPGVTGGQRFDAQAASDAAKIWELGKYPGGTWVALWHINDLGVMVGLGDVPPIGDDGVGYTHTLAVPVFGPHAGEWIDLGTLGGEQPKGWEEPIVDISNTGLVASHSTAPDGQIHGVAWTKESGLVDLGTLADTGDPEYSGYNSSFTAGTNKLGTLIVGWSGVNGNADAAVVWTPSIAWKNGKLVTKWKIRKLDTTAFPDLTVWQAWSANEFGQIVGTGYNNDFTTVVGALWNAAANGKGWELTSLPASATYPLTLPFGINDRGEIVGAALSADSATWVARFWQPLDRRRTTYSQPIELALPAGGFTGCEGGGINELGDLVGNCWSDTQNLPVRWTTKNPTFSEIIAFPLTGGFSWGVNNNRIASVTYDSQTCQACGGATQLHGR